ncbi:hypothetical protein PR048_003357 [Dryococelus australis]|uniref:Uncharacterized protein n=1 Tax=Dryococelus australis TaxID=614101 RepID=A0ABQ9INC5_9NEOP|nr:hypothetical protein PR048_003357 [Dryococelus australis]
MAIVEVLAANMTTSGLLATEMAAPGLDTILPVLSGFGLGMQTTFCQSGVVDGRCIGHHFARQHRRFAMSSTSKMADWIDEQQVLIQRYILLNETTHNETSFTKPQHSRYDNPVWMVKAGGGGGGTADFRPEVIRSASCGAQVATSFSCHCTAAPLPPPPSITLNQRFTCTFAPNQPANVPLYQKALGHPVLQETFDDTFDSESENKPRIDYTNVKYHGGSFAVDVPMRWLAAPVSVFDWPLCATEDAQLDGLGLHNEQRSIKGSAWLEQGGHLPDATWHRSERTLRATLARATRLGNSGSNMPSVVKATFRHRLKFDLFPYVSILDAQGGDDWASVLQEVSNTVWTNGLSHIYLYARCVILRLCNISIDTALSTLCLLRTSETVELSGNGHDRSEVYTPASDTGHRQVGELEGFRHKAERFCAQPLKAVATPSDKKKKKKKEERRKKKGGGGGYIWGRRVAFPRPCEQPLPACQPEYPTLLRGSPDTIFMDMHTEYFEIEPSSLVRFWKAEYHVSLSLKKSSNSLDILAGHIFLLSCRVISGHHSPS